MSSLSFDVGATGAKGQSGKGGQKAQRGKGGKGVKRGKAGKREAKGANACIKYIYFALA